MAYPFVLFENIFEDGTISSSHEAAGYPDDNTIDWRQATPFRWKSDALTTNQTLTVDLGVGESANPDTVVIGGHNLGSQAAQYRVEYSNDNFSGDINAAFAYEVLSDDYPNVVTFAASAQRYWRIKMQGSGGGAFSSIPEIGILTLGRRLDFTEGVMADLDPYGFEMEVEDSTNEHGSPLGTNVRYERKRFSLNYDEPGFLVSDFFDPAAGLGFDDDFAPHVKSGKPFWFVWNIDTQADGVYLCKTTTARMPFIGSTLRRGLQSEFVGYREVS